MLHKIHAEITKRALQEHFSTTALQKIIAANLYQDRLLAQIGHDQFHFDNNAFEKSYAYIEEQRARVISALPANDVDAAWSAFGRLTHASQDFYAHSNYIDLWLLHRPDRTSIIPSEVDPLNKDMIDSRALRSGKMYYPLEAFAFVKILKPLVKRLLPSDSHAWMNLDEPGQGPSFAFAYHAAVKRTRIEFEKTVAGLSPEMLAAFVDKEIEKQANK
jgi:hypothetical protein